MAQYTLVIGNKAYSSWSLRPWLAMKHAGLEFDEVRIPLYQDGHPDRHLWPADAAARAHGRALSAEMHAGMVCGGKRRDRSPAAIRTPALNA